MLCRNLLLVLVLGWVAAPAAAQEADAAVYGFGGLTFGDAETAAEVGAGVVGEVLPVVAVYGEFGYLQDLMPSEIQSLLDLVLLTGNRIDASIDAFYGQGGVRIVAPALLPVRPYGQVGLGVARISANFGVTGPDAAFIRVFLDDQLDGVEDATDFMLSAGGGITGTAGPIFWDTGVRYHAVYAGDTLDAFSVRGAIGVAF